MQSNPPRIEEVRFQGEPGLRLVAGGLTADFLPGVGMTGVSLRFRDREHLAVPHGVRGLRSGGTAGLPLLAPWANRLSSWQYRAVGVDVDLTGVLLPTDENDLPIHGLLLGASQWRVDSRSVRGNRAVLGASIDVDTPAFPFPHRVELVIAAGEGELEVRTTVVPTGRRRVPVSFGWHPYFRLPNTPRRRWKLQMPARQHLALDDHSIPTGKATPEPGENAPLAGRTFDDLYRLGRERRLALEGEDGSAIELRCGPGYDFAQVWVPKGRRYAALEPMVAPTNALVDGTAPLVTPGDSFSASFTIRLA